MARVPQVLALALLLLPRAARAGESCSAGAAEAAKGEQLLQVGRAAITKAAEEVVVPTVAVTLTTEAALLGKRKLTDSEFRAMPKPKLLQETKAARAVASESLIKAEITAEEQDILDQHNLARCKHGVPNMTWDAAIAANAKLWADNGVFGHSSFYDANNPTLDRTLDDGRKLGENLAASSSPDYTGAAAVDNWYHEIHDTDGTPEHSMDTEPPDSGKPIGHFTQVVWKDSTKLGCAKGSTTAYQSYWVCQYYPGGNLHYVDSAGNIDVARTKEVWTEQVLAATETGACPDVPEVAPVTAPTPSSGSCEDTICIVPAEQCTTEGPKFFVPFMGSPAPDYLDCPQLNGATIPGVPDYWKFFYCDNPGWQAQMHTHCKKTCGVC